MSSKLAFMVDIETTGTDIKTDEILEIGIVPVWRDVSGFWNPLICKILPRYKEVGLPRYEELHLKFHTKRHPESEFHKKFMAPLMEECRSLPERQCSDNYLHTIPEFIKSIIGGNHTPQIFMGWNASNFDLPFLFRNGLLTPSYYEQVEGKDVLKGDVHYRVYEQGGSLELLVDSTGLSRNTIQNVALDLAPNLFPLPEGKQHDAIYDCFNQIRMQNGFIALARKGFTK